MASAKDALKKRKSYSISDFNKRVQVPVPRDEEFFLDKLLDQWSRSKSEYHYSEQLKQVSTSQFEAAKAQLLEANRREREARERFVESFDNLKRFSGFVLKGKSIDPVVLDKINILMRTNGLDIDMVDDKLTITEK